MKKINSVNIIGMGALGLMYANMIQQSLGSEAVSFLMDSDRIKKYQGKSFSVNGQEKTFNLLDAENAVNVDLVIVAVKFGGLESAVELMKNAVGKDTIIISVLNGISSEETIAARYGAEKIIYTVAQAMDAMKFGNELRYTKSGELHIGVANGGTEENLIALEEFFDRSKVAYVREENIIRRMWSKFMLNVGINQTCMVYGKTYSQVLTEEEANRTFVSAMQEVIELSKAEGINLSQEDLQFYVDIIKTLDPKGTPSMGQDRINKRKSEVELFAGTVIRMSKKHGLKVPTNEFLYEQVKKIEAEY